MSVQAWTGPGEFQEVQAPIFQDTRHTKVVRLSAWGTGHLYRPGIIPGTHLSYSRPQGHSVNRRIMSIKNSNDNIRNRTRDLPPCSAVPQPTAPPRDPLRNEEPCNLYSSLKTITSFSEEYKSKKIKHAINVARMGETINTSWRLGLKSLMRKDHLKHLA
jgi:hypothetical protein